MASEGQKNLHAVVRGRVQGVFFRAWTRETARSLGLKGWVRNRPDGSVEVLAQGLELSLKKLLALLHRGPPSAGVTDVIVDWESINETFDTFDIR